MCRTPDSPVMSFLELSEESWGVLVHRLTLAHTLQAVPHTWATPLPGTSHVHRALALPAAFPSSHVADAPGLHLARALFTTLATGTPRCLPLCVCGFFVKDGSMFLASRCPVLGAGV